MDKLLERHKTLKRTQEEVNHWFSKKKENYPQKKSAPKTNASLVNSLKDLFYLFFKKTFYLLI